MSLLNVERARDSSHAIWEREIIPALFDYIRIPSLSPAYDLAWQSSGHLERAARLIEEWCRAQPIPGLVISHLTHSSRVPLLMLELPAQGSPAPSGTVLMYGHLDKQPEGGKWRPGFGPWSPVREGDFLYGRGVADDGYAAFASLTALRLLTEQNLPHARIVVLIEAGEESGSLDLLAYLEELAPRIGAPDLVICLDSGCGNYEQLWMTTSLRGNVSGTLRVEVLKEGVHSGDASGIVPSSFRILRQLLSRIEDEKTGTLLLPELHAEIPEDCHAQARLAAATLGEKVYDKLPWIQMTPITRDALELTLNRTWRPTLSVTGVGGLPSLEDAGNVLRPFTVVMLSVRLPPSVDAEVAFLALKRELERDPPYGVSVTFETGGAQAGWSAPPLEPWLKASVEGASRSFFGQPHMAMGEGGSISFMEMLGQRFPEAQFLITGLLGPGSGAHGPNEHLHLPTAERLTACVAQVIADHGAQQAEERIKEIEFDIRV